MGAFLLAFVGDLLEDRCLDDITINNFFASLSYKTNRSCIAVDLFSNRS